MSNLEKDELSQELESKVNIFVCVKISEKKPYILSVTVEVVL